MKIFASICILFISCMPIDQNYQGSAITEFGTYIFRDLKLKVYDQNGFLMYHLTNPNGDKLLQENMKISLFHKWALQFDEDLNLWVISSDIGDSCWEWNVDTKKYSRKIFRGLVNKDSVPKEVYKTLSTFHPYSTLKNN